SLSNDGDVSGHHGTPGDSTDYWIVKLDSTGEIDWQRSLGGSDWDEAYSIQQTSDGGFIVAGFSLSNNGDVSGHHGSTDYPDYWVVKLNSAGNIEWQKCLGGSDWDGAASIQQTSDGGFIVAGGSGSNDGDVSGNHGSYDYWVVKLSPEDGISENALPEQFAINVFPNPFNSSVAITAPAGAEIEIYDITGSRVWGLGSSFSPGQTNGADEAGSPYTLNPIPCAGGGGRAFIWTPDDNTPSGVYLVRLTGTNASTKVIYMK
ncbi:hypothetical protein DRQ36_09570, partial [bacterium]